eukprot:Em0007g729a
MSSDEKTKLVPGGGNATRTRTADDSCELKVSAGGYGSGQPRASLTTQHSGVQPMRSSQLLLSDHCDCHVKDSPSDATSRNAQNKLWIACGIALVFMIAEVVGGLLSNSLAILTDAAHMLSDFAAFLISLFAIWIARRPASQKMSFGWYRAGEIQSARKLLIIAYHINILSGQPEVLKG